MDKHAIAYRIYNLFKTIMYTVERIINKLCFNHFFKKNSLDTLNYQNLRNKNAKISVYRKDLVVIKILWCLFISTALVECKDTSHNWLIFYLCSLSLLLLNVQIDFSGHLLFIVVGFFCLSEKMVTILTFDLEPLVKI